VECSAAKCRGAQPLSSRFPSMLLNAPKFSHKKFCFLLSRWLAGRFTRKQDRVGTRREVDADRILREACRGALVATTHTGEKSTDEAGADVITTGVTGAFTFTAFQAGRITYWLAEWRCSLHTFRALLSRWAGRITYWFAALALSTHALLPLIAAVEALAAVILVSIKVYAPVVAAVLAFRAATNLIVSPPNAVPRAALGVPPTFPAQTPAIVGPSNPWNGGQRSP
jgi:hypothetical protein